MDDESEVGLVEPHPERGRGRDHLDVVVEEPLFGGDGLFVLRLAAVGDGVDPARAEPEGHMLGVGGGQAVHDPGAGKPGNVCGEPGEAFGLRGQVSARTGGALPDLGCPGA